MSEIHASGRRWGKNTQAVEQFNKICPIGTHVLYWPGVREGEGRKSVTRSAAWLLGGHSPSSWSRATQAASHCRTSCPTPRSGTLRVHP